MIKMNRNMSLFPIKSYELWKMNYDPYKTQLEDVFNSYSNKNINEKSNIVDLSRKIENSIIDFIDLDGKPILFAKANGNYVNLHKFAYSDKIEYLSYCNDMDSFIWNTCSLIVKSIIETEYPQIKIINSGLGDGLQYGFFIDIKYDKSLNKNDLTTMNVYINYIRILLIKW